MFNGKKKCKCEDGRNGYKFPSMRKAHIAAVRSNRKWKSGAKGQYADVQVSKRRLPNCEIKRSEW